VFARPGFLGCGLRNFPYLGHSIETLPRSEILLAESLRPVRALDKNLTIVSEAERHALYGLPDFDEFQRADYFALTQEERAIASPHAGFPERIACMLQIGYFKAKHAFFHFRLTDIPAEDIQFLMRRYFPGQTFRPNAIQRNAFLRQRREIIRLFGYRFWSYRSAADPVQSRLLGHARCDASLHPCRIDHALAAGENCPPRLQHSAGRHQRGSRGGTAAIVRSGREGIGPERPSRAEATPGS